MAIGRVNTGGGLSNAFAVIAVTYPAGSVCTCTNGTKTLKAKDSSGNYLFYIPAAGTWTVSCTDGTETASQAVSITTQYQTESVILSYWQGGLYYYGNEFTATTGGWEGKALEADSTYEPVAPELTKNADNMVAYMPSAAGKNPSGVIHILRDVPVTDYTTLTINYDLWVNDSQGGGSESTLIIIARDAAYQTDAVAIVVLGRGNSINIANQTKTLAVPINGASEYDVAISLNFSHQAASGSQGVRVTLHSLMFS